MSGRLANAIRLSAINGAVSPAGDALRDADYKQTAPQNPFNAKSRLCGAVVLDEDVTSRAEVFR